MEYNGSLIVKYYNDCYYIGESNCVTIIDCQLSCDMLIERAVLPSKMPKNGSLKGNTKGLLSCLQNPCVHLPPVAQRLQKKILFACIL